jgi:hypothetical protein
VLFYGVAMKIFLPFLALSLILTGCTGYQLGSTLPEGVESVFIKVENKTDEPSIEVAVMKAIRSEIQMDGSLRLADAADADATLLVSLNNFYLRAVAYDADRGDLAKEYQMVITASFILYKGDDAEDRDNLIIQSPSLRGDEDFSYASDLTTAKLGVLPDTADDLARQIVSMITSAW